MGELRHIFFDLDHTLWDFQANSRAALTEIHSTLKLTEKGVGDLEAFLTAYEEENEKCWSLYREGRMSKEVLRSERFLQAFRRFGVVDETIAKRAGDSYIEISPRKTELVAGTLELLEHLANRNYRLHILTNGFEEVQHLKVERSGLAPYFERVITSEQVGVKKPHPEAFLAAMRQSSANANESMMIGDNLEVDVIGARKVGMLEAFFNPDGQEHNEELHLEIKQLLELKSHL